MAPRHCGWRALAEALALAACLAWAAPPAARAQQAAGHGLVYEKWLDLSLNPADTRARPSPRADAPAPPATAGMRVVHGQEAQSGAWPSAVNIAIQKDGIGRVTCGGTVVGARWVLTAAHCTFKKREGGVSLVRAATVYANSRLRFDPDSERPYEGEVLRVRRVVVHTDFAKRPGLVDDIALLELEEETTAQRQTLAAGAGLAALLAPGTIATVVGWGVTAPVPLGAKANADPFAFPTSNVLTEAELPIAPRETCTAFLKRPASAAEFCAGDGAGGADACNGDSGGPLFVAGHAGEPVQAGIVSWGPGCAQPQTYGVYTSVGHFQGWIRTYVADARFAAPQAAAPALTAIAGAVPGGPPAPRGQVAVDVGAIPCRGASRGPRHATRPEGRPAPPVADADRIVVGSCIAVRVTSGVAGSLGVFSRNARGEVTQLFPNRISAGRQAGATPAGVRAGETLTIPGPADGIDLRVSAPLGRAEVIAVVVPEAVGLADADKPYRGLRTVENFDDELAAMAHRLGAVPSAPRAVGTRTYDVVE